MLDKENISRTQEKFSRPAAMPAHPGAAHAARRPKPQRSCTRTGRRKRLPSLPSPPPPGGAAPPLARKTERQSGSVMKCHEMSRSIASCPSPPALPTLREETPGHVMRCHEMSCSRRAHVPPRPFRPCFGRSLPAGCKQCLGPSNATRFSPHTRRCIFSYPKPRSEKHSVSLRPIYIVCSPQNCNENESRTRRTGGDAPGYSGRRPKTAGGAL